MTIWFIFSFNAISALIPVMLIGALILAAAGLTRGKSLFTLFSVGEIFGIPKGMGKGGVGKGMMKRKPQKIKPSARARKLAEKGGLLRGGFKEVKKSIKSYKEVKKRYLKEPPAPDTKRSAPLAYYGSKSAGQKGASKPRVVSGTTQAARKGLAAVIGAGMAITNPKGGKGSGSGRGTGGTLQGKGVGEPGYKDSTGGATASGEADSEIRFRSLLFSRRNVINSNKLIYQKLSHTNGGLKSLREHIKKVEKGNKKLPKGLQDGDLVETGIDTWLTSKKARGIKFTEFQKTKLKHILVSSDIKNNQELKSRIVALETSLPKLNKNLSEIRNINQIPHTRKVKSINSTVSALRDVAATGLLKQKDVNEIKNYIITQSLSVENPIVMRAVYNRAQYDIGKARNLSKDDDKYEKEEQKRKLKDQKMEEEEKHRQQNKEEEEKRNEEQRNEKEKQKNEEKQNEEQRNETEKQKNEEKQKQEPEKPNET